MSHTTTHETPSVTAEDWDAAQDLAALAESSDDIDTIREMLNVGVDEQTILVDNLQQPLGALALQNGVEIPITDIKGQSLVDEASNSARREAELRQLGNNGDNWRRTDA